MIFKEFNELVDILKKIPTITTRQAEKIVSFFLEQKNYSQLESEFKKFIEILSSIKECSICKYYSILDKCEICLSNLRENKLMIVESAEQIKKYEQWNLFNGKYFIIPYLVNKKFENINTDFDFDFFVEYASNFDEIIIAISPTPEGILTSNLIFDKIKKEKPNLLVSSFGIGVPIGSSINNIDQLTISQALKNRKEIK